MWHLKSSTINRRHALRLGAGAAAAAWASRSAAFGSPGAGKPGEAPVTGKGVPELSSFDRLMTETMAQWALPGGQLAIGRNGRLVYSRGFGFADREGGEVVETRSRFRIASNSKPITTVAILKLIESGKLSLETRVFPLLAYERQTNAPYDPRLDLITVEHLLVHAGGWNSSESYDPQYLPWPLFASHVTNEAVPAEAETIVRFMLTQPLDFDPGTQSAYSNFGFNVLGRLIEKVSGQAYEQYVTDNVLAPAGIGSMAIGGTTRDDRLPDEVLYYSPEGLAHRASVFPDGGFVPVGYGSYYMPSLDAHGGWVASAEDLIRLTLAIDGTRGERLLEPETVRAMEATPRPPAASAGAGNLKEASGLGWNTLRLDGGYEWSHAGALEGSNCSWMVRKPDGTTLAFVFNSLPIDYASFFGDLLPKLQKLMGSTAVWPDVDLFQ